MKCKGDITNLLLDRVVGSIHGQAGILFLVVCMMLSIGTCIWKLTGGSDELHGDKWETAWWATWALFIDPGTQVLIRNSNTDNRYMKQVMASIISIFGHTLVLGWTDKTLYLLNELACEAQRTKTISISKTNEGVDNYCGDAHISFKNWCKFFCVRIKFYYARFRYIIRCCGSCEERAIGNPNASCSQIVVILAERPILEMQESVCSFFRLRHRGEVRYGNQSDSTMLLKIVCRKGNPFESMDLDRAGIYNSRAVIVLADTSRAYESVQQVDQRTLRMVLCITTMYESNVGKMYYNCGRKKANLNINDSGLNYFRKSKFDINGMVLSEVLVRDNLVPFRVLASQNIEPVTARDMINRVMILYGISPIIGEVFLHLLSYTKSSSEIFIWNFGDKLVGKTVREVMSMMVNSVLIGIHDTRGNIVIGPDQNRKFQPNELALLISHNHFMIGGCHMYAEPPLRKRPPYSDQCMIDNKNILEVRSAAKNNSNPYYKSCATILQNDNVFPFNVEIQHCKTIVIIGWPNDMPDLLSAVIKILPTNCVLHALSSKSVSYRFDSIICSKYADMAISLKVETLKRNVNMVRWNMKDGVTIMNHVGNPTARHTLRALPLPKADCILILSDCATSIESDTSSLTSVIIVDDLISKHFAHQQEQRTQLEAAGHSVEACNPPKVLCEIQDPQSSSILNQSLRNMVEAGRCSFFHSGSMETGCIALSSNNMGISSVFSQLLGIKDNITQESDKEIAICSPRSFLSEFELSHNICWNFRELQQRVLDWNVVLIGWCLNSCPTGTTSDEIYRLRRENMDTLELCPSSNKLHVLSETDSLIILKTKSTN